MNADNGQTGASRPTTAQIRKQFLEFFQQRGHEIVASSSLVPGTDKTLLFTNAGMVQFKDVFTGDEKRSYQRATTSQRCVRAGGKHNDLDNVGYTARHHTFFEMLGNFSFGDYFKKQAIEYAWQFLTETLGLPKDRLWVTVFEEDDEAHALWVDGIGVPAERVIRIGAKDNFWAMGDTGPCGPCSEIFYDHGADVEGGPPGSPDEDGDRYIEIWNLVFMQFDRDASGTLTPLPKPCVDTGMGLERIAAVLQHVHSNYEIDLFENLIADTADVLQLKDKSSASLRVIADHIRSCAFLIADGVLPGNEGRGYVLRRIVRRAARHGHKLGANEPFFHRLVAPLVDQMGEAYPELVQKQSFIESELLKEEDRFNATLASGMKILGVELDQVTGDGKQVLDGEVVFKLYDTYGFPIDLTADIARERGLSLDTDGFDAAMERQRDTARKASNFDTASRARIDHDGETTFLGYDRLSLSTSVEGIYVDGESKELLQEGETGLVVLRETPFYGESGGQLGDTGQLQGSGAICDISDTQKQGKIFVHTTYVKQGTLKTGDTTDATVDGERRHNITTHHSATHLLHGGLRHVLGTHVEQRGSLVAQDHLRFDFSHGDPVSEEQLVAVERWVNDEVRANGATAIREMGMDQAIEAGAMALFGEKYGDVVRVVTIGENSVELCGGTHVSAAGDIGTFRIRAETGVAAGVRRVEALAGTAALDFAEAEKSTLANLCTLVRSPREQLVDKVSMLVDQNRDLTRQLEKLHAKMSSAAGSDLASQALSVAGLNVVLQKVDQADAKALRTMIDKLKQSIDNAVIVLASEVDGKVVVIAGVAKSATSQVKAGDLVKQVVTPLGGRGGGRDDMAQAGAPSLDGLDEVFSSIPAWIESSVASTTSN